MKATLQDIDALMAISPLDVASYLRAHTWEKVHEIGTKALVWHLKQGRKIWELVLPLDKTLEDFALRLSDVIRILENVEGRSQLDIVSALSQSNADVIKIPANYHIAADGTMLIDDGVAFMSNIREMVMAAACTAVKPKAIHSTKKPNEAVRYIENIRLGQTERGSYVFTVISRVAPLLTATEMGALFDMAQEDPFERRATKTLSNALQALNSLAQRAISNGQIHFEEAISEGVSANLCDAVVGLSEKMDPSKGLPIQFQWSPARPVNDSVPTSVLLTADIIPVIQETSRVLREKSPEPDAHIRGYVIRLQREEGASIGTVQIVDLDASRERKVQIELAAHDYDKAIRAHGDGLIVNCSGELVKEGRGFALRDHSGIVIENE
jgi:hypothetical protein